MKIEEKIVNNIRVLASDVVSNAKSGHTGIVLSAAPIIYTLFAKHYNNSPELPNNILRDRFVLSAGHGSALLYTILYLFGYGITLDDLKNFRKLDSITSGHPELNTKYGIECTTGPLGQGVATAVGMALAQKRLQRYNKPDCKLFDNNVYTLIGDGCLMEGVSYEALCLAGTLGLDNLVVLYDSNDNTLDSDTKNTFALNTKEYVKSLGFDYFLVKNGNDVPGIDAAITRAKKSKRPAFVEIKTKLGYSSDVEGKYSAHGLVMDAMQLDNLRLNLGVKSKLFTIEKDVKAALNSMIKSNSFADTSSDKMKYYKMHYPKDFACLSKEIYAKYVPISYDSLSISKDIESTRNIGGLVLNKVAELNPSVIGGNADLSSCTKAIIKSSKNVEKGNFEGKNIFYGVREFGMACMTNGLALSGYKPFCGTFMVFSDYLRSAVRSSAIMKQPVVYVLSHDSIAVGEDGPTHQPIEHLDSFRVMPNLNVFRPCNVEEAVAAYNIAFGSVTTPSIISLTRQPIRIVSTPKAELSNVEKGAYVIAKETAKLEKVVVATGSEVALALQVKELLEKKFSIGVRVVSVPCVEIFLSQSKEYQDSVIPKSARIEKICIEASIGLSLGNLVGNNAKTFSINEYGVSAAMADVYKYFGFTPSDIAKSIIKN